MNLQVEHVQMARSDLFESDERRPGVCLLVVRPPDAEQTRQTDEVLFRLVQRLSGARKRRWRAGGEKTNEVTPRRRENETNRRLISRPDRSPPARARLIRFRRRRGDAGADSGHGGRPARDTRAPTKGSK